MNKHRKIDELSHFTHYFRMVGESMDGGGKRDFIDGDYLLCDEVDFKDAQEGECYVINQQQGISVIKVTEFNDNHILATHLNPSYPERQFIKDEVHGIYLIKAVQRKVAVDIEL